MVSSLDKLDKREECQNTLLICYKFASGDYSASKL